MNNQDFVSRHKGKDQDFSRDRVLNFKTLAVLMLNKGTKSIQLQMNTAIPKLKLSKTTVDKSAYSRARNKLKHTAFIELNTVAVNKTMYGDGNYQTWHGHRLLAIDGSAIFLPETPDTIKEFGTLPYRYKQRDIDGHHVFGLASVMYDVLNGVSLDAKLEPIKAYEGDLAKEHLRHAKDNDLVIYDRGYCSFRMLATADQAKGDFLVRGRTKSFKAVSEMLAGRGPDDLVTDIKPSKNIRKAIKEEGLAAGLKVRLVRVILDSGEYEVLITSLLDQKKYPARYFKDLYYQRWGIETFYATLKSRLSLENFSGYSPEAIRQDFYVTIFLTGIEAILTLDANKELKKRSKSTKYQQKVNKAVSFNIIKEQAFEIFYSKQSVNRRLKLLTDLFTTSPTVTRRDRKTPRFENSSRQVLSYYKRKMKAVF